MQISLENLIRSLREVFSECNGMTLTQDTQLGELPEWDSMAAVNLQTVLLAQFEVEIPLELLADQTMLREVIEFLQNPIPSEAIY